MALHIPDGFLFHQLDSFRISTILLVGKPFLEKELGLFHRQFERQDSLEQPNDGVMFCVLYFHVQKDAPEINAFGVAA